MLISTVASQVWVLVICLYNSLLLVSGSGLTSFEAISPSVTKVTSRHVNDCAIPRLHVHLHLQDRG